MSSTTVSEDTLQAYVDGRLSADERADVEIHLGQNAADAKRIAQYRDHRRLLQEAFEPVLREPLPRRLASASTSVRWRWPRMAAVLAWIALGAALGWGLREQREVSTAAKEAELVQRARMAHVIYSAETRRAVEVAASQEQDMIRWLSRRMNAAVRVPNLTEFGFEALGGRLLPGSEGPACQLMYQNAAGKRLTIYLSRDAVGARPVRYSDQDTVHVVFWSDGTLAFAVSAELDREELRRIASIVAQTSRTQGG